MKRYIQSQTLFRKIPVYVVYADGTMEPNGRALYWTGEGPAKWQYFSDAKTFDDKQSKLICEKNKNGKHTWVREHAGYSKIRVYPDPLGSFSSGEYATKKHWIEIYKTLGETLTDQDFK